MSSSPPNFDSTVTRQMIGALVLIFVAVALVLLVLPRPNRPPWPDGEPGPGAPEAPAGPGEYLFCFWNVQDLFDDSDDNRKGQGDLKIDPWFARNARDREEKYAHLAEALTKLNAGLGPDILVAVEVESVRSAELLKEALNARIADPNRPYRNVLMKEVALGRHIAPAVITRLPVVADRTRQIGPKSMRILEGRVRVNGHDLVLLPSHWTSRVTDKEGDARDRYGDQLHGEVRSMMLSNPKVDCLVCGDFNDPPDDESVTRHLCAVGDRRRVLSAPPEEALLLDLMAGKDPERYGTHHHEGKWLIFDQIAVTPGMLDDEGWSCDPDSVRVADDVIPRRPNFRPRRPDDRQYPWPFGRENDKAPHGYSDHLPVTVKLRVAGPAPNP
jgi:hypothetical protein